MIGCDEQNRVCKQKCAEGNEKLRQQIEKMREYGYSEDEIARIIGPTQGMLNKTQREIQLYERLRNRDLSALYELDGNQLLIGLRVYMGFSRTRLAQALGISRDEVFRNEKNEYCGLDLAGYHKILAALGLREIPVFVEGGLAEENQVRLRLKALEGHGTEGWFVGS